MRISQQLATTLREAPRDAEPGNQELLIRAGFIRQLATGIYSFLPLGNRVLQKISSIVREEMDRVGGQEVTMTVLQPKDLWDTRPSNGGATRAEEYGGELFTLTDRKGRNMVLGPTHEEVLTLMVKEFVQSYRDLPQLLYQIQIKFRDQFRPRGGLLRTREFLMKDLYSFDATEEGLDSNYHTMNEAYHRIFTRCGLRFLAIQADSGAVGGKESQEFLALTEAGEDDAMVCDRCGYAANREKAEFTATELTSESESEARIEEVYTPNCMSISDLTTYLAIPAAKTMKVVCYVATGQFVLATIRGDLDVNEVKLTNTLTRKGLNTADIHLATAEELIQAGIVAGYTSPLNKSERILIVADTLLSQGNNFVAGGNKLDYHIKNVNYPRDFRVDVWADIASAYDGAICVQCGGILHTQRGTEVGHIFKLGTKYSTLLDATFLDAEGVAHPIIMGSYGIGISRLMAAIVEQSHDEQGIIWPIGIAPYAVALIGLDLDKEETRQAAETLYQDMQKTGIEVLFDDRDERAGVKFNDADLIGLPIRVVISKRSLKNGGIEMKLRAQKESRIVPLADVGATLQEEIRKGVSR